MRVATNGHNKTYPDITFLRAFPSAVWQMPGYTSQRRGTVRTLPN